MSYKTPTIWKDIFKVRSHTFTNEQIDDAQYSNLGALNELNPEFWERYKNLGRNAKDLEELWEIQLTWIEAVETQDFKTAKILYLRMKQFKLKP